jgi:hypothetical protein
MAWRSQMGRVLVGRSLVGRLWRRSLLGIYTRWLGLELPLRAVRIEISLVLPPFVRTIGIANSRCEVNR